MITNVLMDILNVEFLPWKSTSTKKNLEKNNKKKNGENKNEFRL